MDQIMQFLGGILVVLFVITMAVITAALGAALGAVLALIPAGIIGFIFGAGAFKVLLGIGIVAGGLYGAAIPFLMIKEL